MRDDFVLRSASDPSDPTANVSHSCAVTEHIRPVFPIDAMGRRRRRELEHHGASRTPEYRVWTGVIKRCENPRMESYPRYGGRGIRVCPAWRVSFIAFLRDMGPRPSPKHSLDRINNDGNYEPGNCRWATPEEQMRNTSDNRLLTWRGETHTVTEWAEITGLPRVTISQRFHRGWSVERCLTIPRGAAPRGRYGWGRKKTSPTITTEPRTRS